MRIPARGRRARNRAGGAQQCPPRRPMSPAPPRQAQQHIIRLEDPLDQGQRAGSRRRWALSRDTSLSVGGTTGVPGRGVPTRRPRWTAVLGRASPLLCTRGLPITRSASKTLALRRPRRTASRRPPGVSRTRAVSVVRRGGGVGATSLGPQRRSLDALRPDDDQGRPHEPAHTRRCLKHQRAARARPARSSMLPPTRRTRVRSRMGERERHGPGGA